MPFYIFIPPANIFTLYHPCFLYFFKRRLTQAEVWPKYGFYSNDTFNNSDQRIHCDFPNHTLVCPPPWDEPEAVEMIIYLNDVEQCGGPTAVVPRTGPDDPAYVYPMTNMPGFGGLQWRNNREKAEGLIILSIQCELLLPYFFILRNCICSSLVSCN